MPQWVVVAAVLAALGYVVLNKKDETKSLPKGLPEGDSKESPKVAYDRGYAEGIAAGSSDAKLKKLPGVAKVGTTVEQTPDELVKERLGKAQELFTNPEVWMNDAKKAYALGYNLGYCEAYLKNYVKDWKPGSSPASDWPANCPWPPKSKEDFDETMAKVAKFTDSSGATAMKMDAPYWWPTSWGWPPICPPKDWPSGEAFPLNPMNRKEFEAFKSRHSEMTGLEHLDPEKLKCDNALNVLGKMSADSKKMADITRQMLQFGSDPVALENIAKMVNAGLVTPGLTSEQKDAASVIIQCCNDKATALRAIETPLTTVETTATDIGSGGSGGFGGGGLGGLGGGGLDVVTHGNQRVSPEWRGQVPSWYGNPSFRLLR